MTNVIRLFPKATTFDPTKEIDWIFSILLRERPLNSIQPARNWYLRFIQETNAGYEELKSDPRFFISKYWEADALIRFTNWLSKQNKALTSKTRYSIYRIVRTAMDWAYELGITNHIVYHAPMFKGIPETDSRSPYSDSEQEVINVALQRWIKHARNVMEPYKKSGAGIPCMPMNAFTVIIDGLSYTKDEASQAFGLKASVIYRRKKNGWTDRQAVGFDAPPLQNSTAKSITIEGVEWFSVNKAANHYQIDPGTIRDRLTSGATPEQAVGLAPMYSNRSSFESALYDFEERFECDPLKMLRASHSAKYSVKFLMSFFIKLGVWPFKADWRLIMPLAAELSRLTGLNAESVASLTLNSYQAKHPLTQQPCIRYTKVRSGSMDRSDDRELHLSLLEDAEYFIEDGIQQKVSELIELTIALTQKIRHDAVGETINKLFIYEHDEWYQSPDSVKNGVTHIVWGNPSKKDRQANPAVRCADKWLISFSSENGLYDLLGKGFRFNFSRFRSTLINNMVKNGYDLFDIQAAVGHQDISTTVSYLNERALNPEFTKIVQPALESISQQKFHEEDGFQTPSYSTGYTETLCGTGCMNAFNPSQKVKDLTNHTEGSPCKFWNMCLLCEQSSITENGLPKIIAYKWKIEEVLSRDKENMKGRKALYREIMAVIEDLLTPNHHYTEEIINQAEYLASELDDEALDHLVYQGF
ncbi:hypothetical protein [Methylophaga pinxianii]|uniref:hypothetical protein n=1 Tax=Methylophaga pinxianii TaxID=2881052 RepID=UPI001CF3A20B|nr:hypothetical protein [Methylophaga pinxianii]MCB2427680.1 hypothetical protein [Methylophaga pinxianii]UPH46183.1 hypothetical protein LGT42_002560 [Methylophaga pinxianii]